jgi:hypothetical protein
MRFFRLALLALALASPVQAQLLTTGAGGGVAAAPSYQGPGDIASGAIAFYSTGRAYNAAYATAKSSLADLVDTATGLLTCTLKVGTNGYADLTTVYCPTLVPVSNVVTWCTTVGGCSVTKLYDQTGTGNHVLQATLANMPALTFNAQNGLPCAAGTGTSSLNLSTAGAISQNAPYSLTAVAERTGSFTTVQRILRNGTTNAASLAYGGSANMITTNNGTSVSLTASDNAFHAFLVVASVSAPLFAVDSSANTSTASNGTTALSTNQNVMASSTNAAILSGFFCEGGIWGANLNSSAFTMLANMRSAINGWNF